MKGKGRASWPGALAWALGVSAILFAAGTGFLSLRAPAAADIAGFGAIWPLPFAAMALVGMLVASRQPRNSTGWFLVISGVLMTLNAFSRNYAIYALATKQVLPAFEPAAWVGFWTWIPASPMVALGLMVFPDGKPLSRWWKWPTRATLLLVIASCLAALPVLQSPGADLMAANSPGDVPGGGGLGAISMMAPFTFPVAFVSMVFRFRRSSGIERLQMKWLVFAASLLALATLIMNLLPTEDPIDHPLGFGSILVAMTAIPASVGVAILRYRLYDIDIIINKTLVYGVLTTALGAGYFGTVVVLQTLFRPLTAGSDLAIAGSTLAVAALFRPLRRRIQAFVDRRFYRKRYDSARALDEFSSRLRREIDLETLTGELRSVVRETVQPKALSLWLRGARSQS